MEEVRPVKVRYESRAFVVSLPKSLCSSLCIKPGDWLAFMARGRELVARKVDLARLHRQMTGNGGGGDE